MKVSELGEFGLINLLAEMTGKLEDKRLLVGIGDDAAAWKSATSTQLATIDSFTEGIHFPPGIASWEELGWKALAVNLSDIAAMGGIPSYALVSISLPDDTEVEDVTALYHGMMELAKQSGTVIAGGDTCRAPLVSITITVIGESVNGNILTRSAAKEGEQIAVTGYLGDSAAGFEMLTRQLQFDSETMACLKNAFLRPAPRITEGQLLIGHGVKTAIDISDGLVADLKHICQASQVSARVEIDRLPVNPIIKTNFGEKWRELALSGGEDYELLFTASIDIIEKIKKATACPVTVIGEITGGKTGELTIIDSKGNNVNLSKSGWEHFTTS
ncbi:thiamine-phosphate kinase [Chloroflexota bacterium]